MTNNVTIDGQTVSFEFPDADKDNETAKATFIRESDQIPIDKLGKYYLNENVNFLCGSGTSAAIGGKTINKGENPFTSIIAELKAIATPSEYLTHIIAYLESTDLLEKKFDKINQEYLYHLNIRNDVVISKIRLIGAFNPLKSKFKKGIDYFPTLNTDVFTVEEKHLEAIYNSTIKDNTPTLNIGSDIYFPEVKINCDPNILFGKHCAIFGNTGSGKSCTVTSILQGVYLEKNRLHNVTNKKLKTIIIDSNEEYSDIFNTISGKTSARPPWVILKDYSDLELSHKDLSFYELTELLKEDSPNVTPYLKEAVCKLKNHTNADEKIYYEFSQLQVEIENAVPLDARGNRDNFTIGFLKHIIKRIKHYSSDERFNAVFNKKGNSIEDFLNSPTETVLILSLRVSNDILALFVYMISKSIFNYKANPTNREKDNILLVLEEAHRYISTTSSDQINNYYIDKLAREGRKFGVNLMVSTQRPSEVSNTVISQCNSLIVHKVTNIRDLEFIRNTIEYDDKSQIDLLTSLKQQQALVLGEAFAFSSLIRIAEADPLPLSETPKIFTSNLAEVIAPVATAIAKKK